MRPGQQAPESAAGEYSELYAISRFNEARAASPGIPEVGCTSSSAITGFNEARAASPGIQCKLNDTTTELQGFNEARAASPGIR